MSNSAAIYNYEKTLNRELKKLRSGSDVNAPTILKYYKNRVAEGLSLARIIKCIITLRLISRLLGKRFENATREDMVDLLAKIEQKKYSYWTKRDYKVVLKKFYQWLYNCEDGEYPPLVRWIKAHKKIENKLMKNQLLTPEEVNTLAGSARNIRDRALILVLYESGRRIGEILSLRIECVEFDELGARLLVDGKTGKDYSRVIASAPVLATWLDNHPLRNNPKAPVWVGLNSRNRNKQLSYGAAYKVIKDCAERAGIKKRVYCHLFRHSRATHSSTKLNQTQMCAMFGWKQGSQMPSVYIHLSGEDIDEAQAVLNGVRPAKEDGEPFRPKFCSRCKEKNSPDSKYCNRCGFILDVEFAVKVDEAKARVDSLLNKLTEDPEKLERLLTLVEKV